jgi:hypothetical protein
MLRKYFLKKYWRKRASLLAYICNWYYSYYIKKASKLKLKRPPNLGKKEIKIIANFLSVLV